MELEGWRKGGEVAKVLRLPLRVAFHLRATFFRLSELGFGEERSKTSHTRDCMPQMMESDRSSSSLSIALSSHLNRPSSSYSL